MTRKTYDGEPLEVSFGGVELTIRPIKGMEPLHTFELAIVDAIEDLAKRVESRKVVAEALLETAIDCAQLLPLGCPDITPAMLKESTAKERMGLLADICTLNNLARFTPFLSVEILLDLGMRLAQMAPPFPGPSSDPDSSEPELVGTTSSGS